jgi:uncharacterized protein (DUF305 family)
MRIYLILRGALFVAVALLGLSAVRAEGPVNGRAGRAELRFLEGMIDHHQMALDMANDCLAKASTDGVRTLCQNIIDAQTAEIVTMQEWLLTWYNVAYTPIPMAAPTEGESMEGMDHGGHTMEGEPFTDPAMMMGMFAGFNRLEGLEYEIAWLESMIDHHDDAIHMSERLLARLPEATGHAELLALAETIITDQTAEIDQMETLLADLVG